MISLEELKDCTLGFSVGIVLTVTSLAIAYALGVSAEFTWLELLAVATSFACTFLCVLQSRWNFPYGIVTTALYSWLFFDAGLNGIALFNLYLVFALVWGWYRWGPDESTLPVRGFKLEDFWVYASLGVVIGLGLVFVNWLFGQETVRADLVITALSGIAQFMLINKIKETWFIWAIVNVVSIILFWSVGLYLVSIQYVFFLLNTGLGYWFWTKEKT